MAVDLAIAIPTFIGGVLSTLATAFVLILFAISPKRRHFRHWLIVNLTIADFVNATNNTISGLVVLSQHDLSPGPGCRLNGWVGQFSVQAVDFSVLAIALVALWLITQPARVSTMTTRSKIAFCASIWVVPVATSTAALGMGLYGPVSGNWCWIQPQYLGLRYALGHGWRIGIVLLTVAIYVLVFVLVKRRYRHLGSFQNNHTSSGRVRTGGNGDQTELSAVKVEATVTVDHENITSLPPIRNPSSQDRSLSRNNHSRAYSSTVLTGPRSTSGGPSNVGRFPSVNYYRRRNETQQRNKTIQYADVRRIMLLNGYPAFYIFLWLPGLLNRLLESLGQSPRWLKILQASTQFIGFANALTYSYNEGLQRQIRSVTTGRRRLHDDRFDYS
ncbi:hypothetical protein BBP40_002751 [Aspergillus hancockii]|nr:hypothetical protein BBP40_002751 [Aspergillus hancockii]